MKNLIRLQILGAFVTLLLIGTNATADKRNIPKAVQAAVEDLTVCYARGTDSFGRAVGATAVPSDPEDPVNTADPDFAAGLALYRECFSKDFSFNLEVAPGVVAVTIPDPAGGAGQDGALQWANFVNNTFRASGYSSTQHHMGSISSEVHGKNAHMVSYLIATHTVGNYPGTSITVVGGTYTDEVVRENGRWVILQRTLLLTSSKTTANP